ncbi:LysR family transcriptional regulator [Achromobacter xylosoxidans]|jgi:DNA-binding transcriptional LysR family regulator|uniref:HTH-type transcriptional regulator DmlR n=2 Tax=Achromobacter TaxID=222 RepID=A0A6S7D9V2_9BURK|nr:LysR family transcriptional regulator [Achromobacter ruhlandii]AKP89910.1 Transcriptional regulator, LysR family [Achromobacter xylosoxidans]ALX84893.1 LysR family transcriptional regulator [Achromobacter denitrificans]AMG46202.1 LysR family transcriptional regulator [Achromobacter xylosoxidans]AOU92959.1 LysR family transcriptional regulator [Achromobacter ruhlandii]MCI1838731.1 LysR family transcriptional regulator [Achromobacter ruhlandii]
MITTDDLRFFLSLAATSSLAQAARALDVTPPAVTQRLHALEKRLGVRLVNRSGRGTALTDEGRLLALRAGQICGELNELADELAGRRGVVAGHLRVVAPLGFGQRYVAGLVAGFRDGQADVTASLTLSDGPPRLASDDWDVMIHIGELRDSTLVAYPLAPNRRILCASPAYLARHGAPAKPEDLRDHDCIALRENEEDVTLWRFKRGRGPAVGVRIAPVLSSNAGAVAVAWALAGHGIVARSEWDVAEHVKARTLVPLLAGWNLPEANVVALVKSRQELPARTAGFLAHLRAAFAVTPWRDKPQG